MHVGLYEIICSRINFDSRSYKTNSLHRIVEVQITGSGQYIRPSAPQSNSKLFGSTQGQQQRISANFQCRMHPNPLSTTAQGQGVTFDRNHESQTPCIWLIYQGMSLPPPLTLLPLDIQIRAQPSALPRDSQNPVR